ncbi:hypothetical protein HMPREF0554_0055 [Pseudoleptotrichia goodfellowii F0264]|uniref:Uncharacterized protein n=1 Tax=Pseudoleptotrichia goodfellowii F0264 TaxID=596323 RepID=D0GPM1_9FUSO|nr:hypothetical protein HMPREF0554_0055 [Pseudoleptotrichia goodfellowii F0264]
MPSYFPAMAVFNSILFPFNNSFIYIFILAEISGKNKIKIIR